MIQRSNNSPPRWRLLQNGRRRRSESDEDLNLIKEILSKEDSNRSQSPIRLKSIRQQKRNSKLTKSSKQVSFGYVETREYGVIVGDNPTIIGGFPLGLDWRFNVRPPRAVDDCQRPTTIFDQVLPPKSLSIDERKAKLQLMGFSKDEILAQERRRKVILVSEWAFGTNEKQPVFSPQAIVRNYVI